MVVVQNPDASAGDVRKFCRDCLQVKPNYDQCAVILCSRSSGPLSMRIRFALTKMSDAEIFFFFCVCQVWSIVKKEAHWPRFQSEVAARRRSTDKEGKKYPRYHCMSSSPRYLLGHSPVVVSNTFNFLRQGSPLRLRNIFIILLLL